MADKELEKNLIKYLFELKEESAKLPPLPKEEEDLLEADDDFESVYFSSKLEGNQLTEEEARNAIFADYL